jgi:hypothetical protein
MARLPGDAEAAECHRNEPGPVLSRSPDLPARDAVTVFCSYEFIFWEAPDKGCTKLVDVMGFVPQEDVGQGTMHVLSELRPAPPDWCRRHQPRRSLLIETRIGRQAEGLAQQILATVRQCLRCRKGDLPTGPGLLGDCDMNVVTGPIVMTNGDPWDRQIVEATILQLCRDDPPEGPVARRQACGQRNRQMRNLIIACKLGQLVIEMGKGAGR